MFLYMLVALSIGIEGGYNIPAVGFENINAGTVFSIFADRNVGFIDLKLSAQTAFYTGDNPSYSFTTTGLRLAVYKKNWPVSPIMAVGGDYVGRSLNQSNETGFGAAYTLGFLLNFKVNQLHIYPEFYYDGLTDGKKHGGFIGMRIGIAYEI
jgi:hypothetical protein